MDSRLKSAVKALLAALSLTAACGGGGTGPGGSANFTATIDGQGWTSASISTQAQINANATFSIVGGSGGSSPLAMSLILYYIAAPGTYPLGVGGAVAGGLVTMTQGIMGWSTPLSGAAGTVTITTVSATRLAGTFSYTATPFLSGTSGNRVVTNGQFDLPVTGNGSTTVAANLGSKFGGPTGTLGGNPWNAATVVTVSHPSSGTMTIGASNVDYNINVIISGFTGPGTYTLGTGVVRTFTVTRLTGGTQIWGGTNALSGGTLVVTSYTTSRVQGTYNVTLQPGVVFPGPGTMTLTGIFDMGLP